MTKLLPLILACLMTVNNRLGAQDLFNNAADTLQVFETIYYSTFQKRKEFQCALTKGYYVLIFDHKIKTSELGLRINRKYDAPILYQRHNGYFSFEVKDDRSVVYLQFAYDGSLENTGIFAQVYRVAPPIMNTPYPSFVVQDIEGNEYSNKSLADTITLFLFGGIGDPVFERVFHLLDTLTRGYPARFVLMSRAFPSQLKEFKASVPGSHVRIINSKCDVLSPWTEVMSRVDILVVDQQGYLVYKNKLTESDPMTLQDLGDGIRKKLIDLGPG